MSIWLIFTMIPFMVQYYFPNLDAKEFGYRAGMLGSAFSLGSLFGNFIWGIASDRIGRKPALILGLIGSVFTSLMFGFTHNFYVVVFARFLWGLLNGNIGVSKTYVAEILDDTNNARGMALYGTIGGVGRMIGPILGGYLLFPQRLMPSIFAGTIFETYPFSLPVTVVSFSCFVVSILSCFHLPETLRGAWLYEDDNDNGNSHGNGASIEMIPMKGATTIAAAKSLGSGQGSNSGSGLGERLNKLKSSLIMSTQYSPLGMSDIDEECIHEKKNEETDKGKSRNSNIDEAIGRDLMLEGKDSPPVSPGKTNDMDMDTDMDKDKDMENMVEIVIDSDEKSSADAVLSVSSRSSCTLSIKENGAGTGAGTATTPSTSSSSSAPASGSGSGSAKRSVGFSSIVMVKTIGSNAMAFGPLKKVEKGEKPIGQVPDKDEEDDDNDIDEEIIFGDAVTDTSTSKMNGVHMEEEEKWRERDAIDVNAPVSLWGSGNKTNMNLEIELTPIRSTYSGFKDHQSPSVDSPTSFVYSHFGPRLEAPKGSLRYSNGSEFYGKSGIGTRYASGGICTLVGYLLTRKQILLSTFLYGLVGFYGVFMVEIFPLWVVTSKTDGGFDYKSHDIGWAMTVSGPISIIGQILFYPSLVERYGIVKTYTWACQIFFVTAMLMPCASLVSMYPFLSSLILVSGLAVMSTVQMWIFISIFTFINNSCYSHQRSTVNGIGQTFAALGRLSAPYLGSNLFAWSETNELTWPFNYALCWYCIGFLALWSSMLVGHFPKSIQRRKREPITARYASPYGGGGREEEENI